jgi:hypothetical protein
MASKTVLIVGGLIVALGAVAYISMNGAPASKDAAGTIVEAKRARADGAGAAATTAAPNATTDASAAEAAKGTSAADTAAASDAATAAGTGGNGAHRFQATSSAHGANRHNDAAKK